MAMSLRGQISMVTQDTSLLHRSIADNIRYGRPTATEAEVIAAAKLAHADEFILALEDWKGRRGYQAHVGERGVKLSGSALDSEVEAAIQESLGALMAGKTVIAIAHRLSTIARMDRLVVLDHGHIVEQGNHDALLRANGHYAALWRRQSGGFIDAGVTPQAAE
jgi:ATP-binding cassette subfamily B multidrug efflux pump